MSDDQRGRFEDISPQEVAGYVRDVAAQLAHMAREMRFRKLGELLEEATREAERLAQENADPSDAA